MEFTISVLIFQVFLGLVLGALYVLLASGLSLIFGLMGVINFAHGVFYMLGAYAGFYILLGTGGNFWLALIGAPIIIGILGMLVERTLLRPLYDRDVLHTLFLTFALILFIPDLGKIVFGLPGKSIDIPPLLQGGFFYESINIFLPYYRIFILAITAIAIFALYLILNKTDLGTIIRAGINDQLMVKILGLDLNKIRTLTFGIGVAIAALGGIVAAPIRRVHTDMGMTVLINSFAVVVTGGMGSLKGAVVGGLLIGEIVAMSSLFYGEIGYIMIFITMAIVLLVRPRGLFGQVGIFEE